MRNPNSALYSVLYSKIIQNPSPKCFQTVSISASAFKLPWPREDDSDF